MWTFLQPTAWTSCNLILLLDMTESDKSRDVHPLLMKTNITRSPVLALDIISSRRQQEIHIRRIYLPDSLPPLSHHLIS